MIPRLKGKQKFQSLRNQSFQVNGPRLFNCLPKNIRNIKKVSVPEFKEHLDKFLGQLPDQPKVGDLIPNVCDQLTARPSNSIVDVVNHIKNSYGRG